MRVRLFAERERVNQVISSEQTGLSGHICATYKQFTDRN